MCASLLLVSRRAPSSHTRRACAALSTRLRPDDCARSASIFSSEPPNLPFYAVSYRGSQRFAQKGFSGVRILLDYELPGSDTEERTASSIVSTASFLLKPLPRSRERQVWK